MVFCALLAWLAAGQTVFGQAAFTSSLNRDQGLLELRYNGHKVLTYAFAKSQFKPYVRELLTLQGDSVLVDAPPDHLHHHGLMYGIRVNGVNFWEERDQPGYEKSVELDAPKVGMSRDGLPQASFTHLIHWVSSQNASTSDTAPVAMLIERRHITLTADEKTGEVALVWQSDFEVGPGAPKATLAGANYHGLGLRLPPSFNRTAQHRNSENAPYPTEGKGDVNRARWSCVSQKVGDREISVAMFGQPTTDRGLPSFFTMVQPFTYLSVTQGLDKEPIAHERGDKFSLNYLLVAYSKHLTPESLDQRYQRWTQAQP